MTISTTTNKVVAQGNGLTVTFSFGFPVPLASQLFVYYTDASGNVTAVPPSQYTAFGIGSTTGGSVTYPISGSPIPSGTSLTIVRTVSYQQLTELVNQSGYYPSVVEGALDYLTMEIQQLAEAQSRAFTLPIQSTGVSLAFPVPVAGLGIGWDPTASFLENIDFVAESAGSAEASAASAAASAASAVTSEGAATEAVSAAAALDFANTQLATGIVTFNSFDLGFVTDVPAGTSIDLGTVP